MDFIRPKTIPPIIFISEHVCLRCTLHGYYSKTASFFYEFLKVLVECSESLFYGGEWNYLNKKYFIER